MTQFRRFANRVLLTGCLRAAAHITRVLHKDPEHRHSFIHDAEHESGYAAAREGRAPVRKAKGKNTRTSRPNTTEEIVADLKPKPKRSHHKKVKAQTKEAAVVVPPVTEPVGDGQPA